MDLLDLYHAHDHSLALDDTYEETEEPAQTIVLSNRKCSKRAKEAKFVPWEPYKAAPDHDRKGEAPKEIPRLIPYSTPAMHVEEASNATNVLVDGLKYKNETSNNNTLVSSDASVEIQIAQLHSELEAERSVNRELKSIFLKSLGDDFQCEVEALAGDKVQLSRRLENYCEKVVALTRELEDTHIEADVWKCKFMAQSIRCDEISRRLNTAAVLLHHGQEALRNLGTDLPPQLHKFANLDISSLLNRSPCDPRIMTQIENVDRLAAIIIFLTSLVGVIINTFIAFYIRRISVLKNSFGRLLQLQAVGDAIFEAVWCLYFAPTLFLNVIFLQDLRIAARFGQLCLICYDISIYTHLIISFNRFICLYFPTKYSRVFTDRFTNVLVIAIVGISFTFSWFLVAVECVMGFSTTRWMLDYGVAKNCNMTNVYYAEFVRGLILISIFAAVNTLTFIRMNIINRKKKEANKNETVQQQKRRVMEKSFVQQVTIQGFIYVAELTTYFWIANYFPVAETNVSTDSNRWPNFLLTTYAWILVHTLDGIVTVSFNRQFRQALSSPFRQKVKATVSNEQPSRSRLSQVVQ